MLRLNRSRDLIIPLLGAQKNYNKLDIYDGTLYVAIASIYHRSRSTPRAHYYLLCSNSNTKSMLPRPISSKLVLFETESQCDRMYFFVF